MAFREPIALTEIELNQLNPADNLLQSPFWGEFKGQFGWKPRAFRYQWREHRGTLLVLQRKILGFLPLAYVPFGPDLPEEDQTLFLNSLSWELVTQLPLGTLFIRYDLRGGTRQNAMEARSGQEAEDAPITLGDPLKKSPHSIQPPDTVIISLQGELDSIMAAMHKKWRYNIRLAEKKGVKVELSEPSMVDDWYRLYQETAQRDKIALHPLTYYKKQFELAEQRKTQDQKAPELQLLTARHEGDFLAGIIVAIEGNRATYLYGASSNQKRNLMPAYALQWRAMEWAKSRGCTSYDLFGIPPKADPDHPMHGLYLFKTGFGGEVHHYLGAWDYPYSKVFYWVYRGIEGLRNWYYKVFKKR